MRATLDLLHHVLETSPGYASGPTRSRMGALVSSELHVVRRDRPLGCVVSGSAFSRETRVFRMRVSATPRSAHAIRPRRTAVARRCPSIVWLGFPHPASIASSLRSATRSNRSTMCPGSRGL
jgi:hypothetical protein